ncbi:Cysteine desulfurase [hydrothermal vent metagenome]|uniref:Cysteine desulfurase n=1 Tax=hydrothermal vent metagenome TaxID=652676 RepID=A0A3B0R4L8_9ZZZZ
MILPCQRDKFDIPSDVTYLDCAYMSPLPKQTLLAGEAGLHKKAQPWRITGDDFFDLGEQLRGQMAQMVSAKTLDFALIPSVSYGMSVIAKNLNLNKGAEVLVLAQQFPSNIYPWLELCQQQAANLNMVSAKSGQSWTEAVLAAICPQTALLALPHVHWIDGGLLDLVAIGKAARAVGAVLVLDLTQSLGAVPFNVREVDPDFFVVANYKWLLGPYSTGFLYAAKRQQNGTPLEQCWQSRKGAENFAGLTQYTDQLSAGASRYDMGERSNFAALPAVAASLAQLLDWGVKNITETLGQTTKTLAKIAQQHGLHSASTGPRAPHYLSLQIPKNAPPDLLIRARAQGVYFSHRGERLRITPHLWVNDADMTRFDQVLDSLF